MTSVIEKTATTALFTRTGTSALQSPRSLNLRPTVCWELEKANSLSAGGRLSANRHVPSSFYFFPMIRKPGHIYVYCPLSDKDKWRAFSPPDNVRVSQIGCSDYNLKRSSRKGRIGTIITSKTVTATDTNVYGPIKRTRALAGVVQWMECQPVNQRVNGSIPSQGTCLGWEANTHWCFSISLSPSLPLSKKK